MVKTKIGSGKKILPAQATARELQAKAQSALPTGRGRVSYKGIPAEHRKAVQAAVHLELGVRKLTPQQVYRKLLAHWEKQREALDAKANALLNEQRSRALADTRESLMALAVVRDVLERLSDGTPNQVDRYAGMDIYDFAAMAHSHMAKYGAQLESALYLLDVVKGKNDCYFIDDVPAKLLK